MERPVITMVADASGAAYAARQGQVVVIVDIIDMSTTLEAMLEEGALAVYGAAPDAASPPVPVNPERVGLFAGNLAVSLDTSVIVVAEPRAGSADERLSGIQKVLRGIKNSGAVIETVLPNMGAETAKLTDVKGRVVVASTGSGGVAFDAALTACAPVVLTGTIARTVRKKGPAPARAAAVRAIKAARKLKSNIAITAASGNSMEDVLGAMFIYNLLLDIIR